MLQIEIWLLCRWILNISVTFIGPKFQSGKWLLCVNADPIGIGWHKQGQRLPTTQYINNNTFLILSVPSSILTYYRTGQEGLTAISDGNHKICPMVWVLQECIREPHVGRHPGVSTINMEPWSSDRRTSQKEHMARRVSHGELFRHSSKHLHANPSDRHI